MLVGTARVWYAVVSTAHNTTLQEILHLVAPKLAAWGLPQPVNDGFHLHPSSKFQSVCACVSRCVPAPWNQYSAVISSYIALYSTLRHRNVNVKEKKTI